MWRSHRSKQLQADYAKNTMPTEEKVVTKEVKKPCLLHSGIETKDKPCWLCKNLGWDKYD